MPVVELTEPELVAWGERLGRTITYPLLIAFSGELGAGKTTLVRAIARSQGALEPVTSQSYGIVREYLSAKGHVFHLDLYRLEGPQDLPRIGWDDILRIKRALVMVEWPEWALGQLPAGHLALHLEHVPDRPEIRRLSW